MPTRFYFPSNEAAPFSVVPAAQWDAVGERSRWSMTTVRGTSGSAIGTQVSWTAASAVALDRQYIGPAMAAGNTFNGATLTGQLMCREYATGDNTQYLYCGIRVCNSVGTIRTTLVTAATHTTFSVEFINNISHRNQKIFDGDSISAAATYVTALGDRLVVEIGYGDNAGASPEGSGIWGTDMSDLPINNTRTSPRGNAWLEFSNAISWPSSSSFTTLPVTGTLMEKGFASLITSGAFKQLGFSALAAAGNIVAASTSSFTFLAAAGRLLQIAFDTLFVSGSLKELGANTVAVSGAIKETGFASVGTSGAIKSLAASALQASGAIKEPGYASLAVSGGFAAEGVDETMFQRIRRRFSSFLTGKGVTAPPGAPWR